MAKRKAPSTAFKPGERPVGRQKGTQNKVNADVKSMILGALSEGGGQDWLVKQMTANPIAFMSLIGRVLPLTIAGDPTAPISIHIVTSVPRATDGAVVMNGQAKAANGHAARA